MISTTAAKDAPTSIAGSSLERSVVLLLTIFLGGGRCSPLFVSSENRNTHQVRVLSDVLQVPLTTTSDVVFRADDAAWQDEQEEDRQRDCGGDSVQNPKGKMKG